MADRPKLLLLDDDPDMLEIYREILQRLPSGPEIQTATSGTRAISMLEAEPFQAIVTDLSMPKMDGLQVLSVVRRRWPQLRTVVMTSVVDEQMRKRAQGMGVDLFTQKPSTSREIETFLAAIDNLVNSGGKPATAAPAPESKGLAETLRLETLSRNSSVIRCIYGGSEGRVWIQRGEPIDASSPGRSGEEALNEMLSWPGAKCETMPGEPARPRRIFRSSPDSVPSGPPPEHRMPLTQSEANKRVAVPASAPAPTPVQMNQPQPPPRNAPAPTRAAPAPAQGSTRAVGASELAGVDGVEMLLSIRVADGAPQLDSWNVEHPDEVGHWMYSVLRSFHALGEKMQTGKLVQVDFLGAGTRWALVPRAEDGLLIGLRRTMVPEQARDIVKQLTTKWAS